MGLDYFLDFDNIHTSIFSASLALKIGIVRALFSLTLSYTLC